MQDAYNGVASLYSTVSGFFVFFCFFSQLGEGKTYWTLFIYFILFLTFLLWEINGIKQDVVTDDSKQIRKRNPQEYAQFNKPPSSYIVVFTYFDHSVEPLKPAFFQ